MDIKLSSIMIVQIAVLGIALGWGALMLHDQTKVCTSGVPGGPPIPINSSRVKLSDGRYLAYKEAGVSKKDAVYKIIISHGFDSSKDLYLPISKELIIKLRIYLLSFDRAGYGESDPNPNRSVKSEAFDIQELADMLQIGTKFYVIGFSLGAYPIWSCLEYIPHRLSGAALVVPFVNFWWPCFPARLAKEAFSSLLVQDQWAFRVAHYTPWLFNWWKTRKWIPSSGIMDGNKVVFSCSDLDLSRKFSTGQGKITRHQGVYESLFRDVKVGFGKWEFDPLDITNPFPNNEGSVHIWQGYEDRIIPFKLNRYLSQKQPWIQYHEVPDAGHLLFLNASLCEDIFKDLLLLSN